MRSAIIDTHLHLIDRQRLSYPWLADAPALDSDFHYDTYAAEARRCGVTDVLHMEVDVAPADIVAETRNVEAIAAQPGSLLRGVISARIIDGRVEHTLLLEVSTGAGCGATVPV